MAIGVIWNEIWDEAIWVNDIWQQVATTPPAPVASTGNQRRHPMGLVTYMRR